MNYFRRALAAIGAFVDLLVDRLSYGRRSGAPVSPATGDGPMAPPVVVLIEEEIGAIVSPGGPTATHLQEMLRRGVTNYRAGQLAALELSTSRAGEHRPWVQYGSLDALEEALRPRPAGNQSVRARPNTWLPAFISGRYGTGRLTADSVLQVGNAPGMVAREAIPLEVAHHPYGRSEAVRIMAALDQLGFVPVNKLDLLPFRRGRRAVVDQLFVVPTNAERVSQLAQAVQALRCQIAAQRVVFQRHLDGADVPDAAFYDV
jgi:hypothetical protein